MSQWCEPRTAAVAYADLIYHRVRDGMLINDWTVDWSKEPLTHSFYPEAAAINLPLPGEGADVFRGVAGNVPEFLASLLHISYGITGVRLTINRNDHMPVYRNAEYAKWGRTTASGGGRYCVDFYLVDSGIGHDQLDAGMYHYTPLRHAWELLTAGDFTGRVARAQGYARAADRYLIMTINYWRSGFKYNDFAYQATAMDVGTVMATMAEAAGDRLASSWDMWVNEDQLAPLLGLDQTKDGIYAVQAWGNERDVNAGCEPDVAAFPGRVTSNYPGTIDFTTTIALQNDMMGFPQRPAELLPNAVSDESPNGIAGNWWSDLMRRQSSFGRFTGRGFGKEDLLGLLSRADRVSALVAPPSSVVWEYLVYVARVDDVEPGLYRYRPFSGDLELVSTEDQSEFLASTYFLKNYDGKKAAATVIPCANVYECARKWGVRGYRLVNAVIGAACQALSVEAARRGLGSGTALGFDAEAHADHAGLDKESMTPMLMIMTGVDDPLSGQFHSNATARRLV